MKKKPLPPVVLDEKINIPIKWVNREAVRERYEHDAFNPSICERCEYLNDRPCLSCEGCEGFQGHFKFWSRTLIDGTTYVSVPIGDRKSITKIAPRIRELPTQDDRPRPKLRYAFNWNAKKPPYPYQKTGVSELVSFTNGILKAPPRSGKTVMAVMVIKRLGLRTIIMAHQEDLLKQFLIALEDFTDIRDHEKFSGRKRIGICRTLEDFKKYDIALTTYQMFISVGGKKKLHQIKDLFGVAIVDEIHRGSAACYSQVLNTLNTRYRYGLTATPERKDGLEFVIQKIIGPIRSEVAVETLRPALKLIPTGERPKHEYKVWTYAMRWLQNNEARNALIVKHAVHDLRAGHSILIPVTFREHTAMLVDAINKRMGKPLAAAFNGSLSKNRREEVLAHARSGKIRCVVGMRSMLTGINIPRWNYLYEIMPISNEPNMDQETARILTPLPGKKAVIKFFIDLDWGISRSCFLTCLKTFKKNNAMFTPKSREILGDVFNKHRRRSSSYESPYDTAKEKADYGRKKTVVKEELQGSTKARFKSKNYL